MPISIEANNSFYPNTAGLYGAIDRFDIFKSLVRIESIGKVKLKPALKTQEPPFLFVYPDPSLMLAPLRCPEITYLKATKRIQFYQEPGAPGDFLQNNYFPRHFLVFRREYY